MFNQRAPGYRTVNSQEDIANLISGDRVQVLAFANLDVQWMTYANGDFSENSNNLFIELPRNGEGDPGILCVHNYATKHLQFPGEHIQFDSEHRSILSFGAPSETYIAMKKLIAMLD